MSPEAAALAARLRDRWDDLGREVGVPAPLPERLELLRATGCPIHRPELKESA